MSICAECGEFELYYVLACGDSAVGESKILLYAGVELQELKQEIRTVDEQFGNLEQANRSGDPQEVVDAQDQLANFLKDYIKPTADLPEKHMVQAYAIKGKKWTRIRSDQMRNHWRSYDIDKSLLEASQQDGQGNQLPRQPLRDAFAKVRDDIAGDIRSGINKKGQLLKGSIDGSITDMLDVHWLKWVDAVNDSLIYTSTSSYHDLSAGAQLLRAYAGFGVQLGHNPKTNTYGLSASGDMRAVLAEAKASFTGHVPHREGWHALINFGARASDVGTVNEQLNFGYFRGSLTISAHAMLGASIMGTAGVEYSPGPSKPLLVQPSMAGAHGEISLAAFAGVEAGGSATGSLEWHNPGVTDEKGSASESPNWAAMISLGVSIAGNAGIGAQADFYIDYENGKFMFRAKLQAVVGLGAKGGVSGTLNPGAVFELVKYIYHQLKDKDFGYLAFVSQRAFDAVVALIMHAVEYGLDAISTSMEQIIGAVRGMIKEAQEAEDYARKVKANRNVLAFAPPEAKGAILYRLSETFLLSLEEHQEAAILVVLETIQTKREWEQVVERITLSGSKGDPVSGRARLRWIMDGGSGLKYVEMERRMQALPPRTITPGAPVLLRNYA